MDNNITDYTTDYYNSLCVVCSLPYYASYADSITNEICYNYTYTYDELINYTYSYDCPQLYIPNNIFSTASRIATSFVFILTVVLTIVGNSVAICILSFGNRVRTNFNTFLINLAVSDLAMGALCMPFTTIQMVIEKWPFGDFMCPFVSFIQQVSVTVSICTLTVIGIDRYLAVVQPMRNRKPSSKPILVISLIWLVSCLLGIFQLVTARTKAYPMNTGEIIYDCDERWNDPVQQSAYEVFVIVSTYVIPLIILSATYSAVVKVLWARQIPGNGDKLRDHRHSQSKLKVTKMLMAIVILFALCWLPLHCFILTTMFHNTILEDPSVRSIAIGVYLFSHWLAMANSFINPFIYTICHEGFRADLRNFCTLCRRGGMDCVSHLTSPRNAIPSWRSSSRKTPTASSSCRTIKTLAI
ncbi:QRFP-like peptide receptor [Saccoglossus kowalevskii]|uniref:Tachykinin-like peptides receptor 86C-like n=1 Tax=Saccoglossus kowalevskii TaxID=10224 RepID=A0ABM0GKD9_SACKO|nr:PREDICTED: tachykinin-like peptides receptor 86C-like [Saccoglossus kowalevskii]